MTDTSRLWDVRAPIASIICERCGAVVALEGHNDEWHARIGDDRD